MRAAFYRHMQPTSVSNLQVSSNCTSLRSLALELYPLKEVRSAHHHPHCIWAYTSKTHLFYSIYLARIETLSLCSAEKKGQPILRQLPSSPSTQKQNMSRTITRLYRMKVNRVGWISKIESVSSKTHSKFSHQNLILNTYQPQKNQLDHKNSNNKWGMK